MYVALDRDMRLTVFCLHLIESVRIINISKDGDPNQEQWKYRYLCSQAVEGCESFRVRCYHARTSFCWKSVPLERGGSAGHVRAPHSHWLQVFTSATEKAKWIHCCICWELNLPEPRAESVGVSIPLTQTEISPNENAGLSLGRVPEPLPGSSCMWHSLRVWHLHEQERLSMSKACCWILDCAAYQKSWVCLIIMQSERV